LWCVNLELFMTLNRVLARRGRWSLGIGLLWAVAACGGGEPAGKPSAELATAASVVAPLIYDDGTLAPSDPKAVPRDAAAWTHSGLYATATQAAMLAQALGDDALRIEVGCCRLDAVDEAVGITWGLQAARSLPADTPVLIHGLDLRLAAATANRLTNGGLTHVWLVTQ
jgi:hypothetical protein